MIHSKQEDGFRGIQEGSTVAETEKKLYTYTLVIRRWKTQTGN